MSHYLENELYSLVQKDGQIFNFLQQGSLDGIWYWDLEDRDSEWMSPRFWEILGYDPAEKKHEPSEWFNLIFADDLKVAMDNFELHCADPNHPYDQVVRYLHRDGSTVWVRCRGVVIRNEAGKPIRMLGAHTDVTALKKAEIELERRTKELEEANRKLALLAAGKLNDMIPVCSVCKKIRDDQNQWLHFDHYLKKYGGINVSHSYCPTCAIEAMAAINAYDEK